MPGITAVLIILAIIVILVLISGIKFVPQAQDILF